MLHCIDQYRNKVQQDVPRQREREVFCFETQNCSSLLRVLVEEMFDFHSLPIRYFLGIMKPKQKHY